MAQYRLLADHWINQFYFLAGTTLTMADNWVPSNAVDPLDTPAVNAFWAAGPRPLGLVRQQWSDIQVALPITYWKQIPGGNFWQLTGLGSAKPPIGI
jgi:hypothetical protein